MRYWRTKRKVTEMVGYLPSPFLRCFKHHARRSRQVDKNAKRGTNQGSVLRIGMFPYATLHEEQTSGFFYNNLVLDVGHNIKKTKISKEQSMTPMA